MALLLESSVRTDIITRRRYTLDKRIANRLSAVLWANDGRSQQEIADLLGVTARQVRKWLRRFRLHGLDALCTLGFQGDPGKLRPAQIERLKDEIATGRFLTAQQICDWVQEFFRVSYSPPWDAKSAAPHRCQLPQGQRVLLEGRSGQAGGVHP
jgi:transposase